MGRRPGRRPTPEPDPGPDRATIPHCPRDARPCRWSAGSPLAQLAVVGRPPGAATSHCQQLGPEDAEDRLAATSTTAAACALAGAGRAVASSFEVVTYLKHLPLLHTDHDSVIKVGAATRTRHRPADDGVIRVTGLLQREPLRARLLTRPAPRPVPQRPIPGLLRIRRVRRGRLGGVRGILAQPALQLLDTLNQHSE